MESIHPRLDEMESRFGWSRGMKTDTGVIAVDREARTTVDGRTVNFLCYRYRREGLRWDCGAMWSAAMSKRQRKEAKKKAAELVALTLDPAARAVLGSSQHPSHVTVEDGFNLGTGGIGYGAVGEPPPAEAIVTLAELLAAMAAKIEFFLGTSKGGSGEAV